MYNDTDKLTVGDLRKLLEGVPDDATVQVGFETAIGDALKRETFGYDPKDNTFMVGTS